MWNDISVGLAFVFALIGVIGDALNKTLVLETMTWLLLGVIFAVISLTPMINLAAMRHLYGIESENKNK